MNLVLQSAPILLVGLFMVPMSGCLSCSTWNNSTEWFQDDVPMTNVQFRLEDLYGNAGRRTEDPNRGALYVNVYSKQDPVTHDDLVRFTEALFLSKGWPAPTLGGQESQGCARGY